MTVMTRASSGISGYVGSCVHMYTHVHTCTHACTHTHTHTHTRVTLKYVFVIAFEYRTLIYLFL